MRRDRPAFAPGFLLGFAAGGFFDGVLLHQILQWHHLLSLVQAEPFRDPRVQIMADGVFHALMYVVAAAGLWLLWRRRAALSEPGRTRGFVAALLWGFGIWHLVDAILFHWILGVHHIRPDARYVLAWDLAFFGLGLAACAAGRAVGRGAGGGGSAGSGRRAATVHGLAALAVAGLGAWAARPVGAGDVVTLVFAERDGGHAAFAAAAALDARVVRVDAEGAVATLALARPGDALGAVRAGAIWVAGWTSPGACFAPRLNPEPPPRPRA